MSLKDSWSGGSRGVELERQKVVAREHSVWNRDNGGVEIGPWEWNGYSRMVVRIILGKEVRKLRHQDVVKSCNLDIRMVILCISILS